MPDHKTQSPVISVSLNSPIDTLKGKPWPRATNAEPLGMTAIEYPAEISLRLPSSRVLNVWSKHTIIQQERGIITLVSVLPLREVVEFATAITRAEEITRSQGVGDRKFFETLEHWHDAPPSREPSAPKYMARAQVELGVNLYVKIRPSNDETGWFIALDYQRAARRSV